MATCHGNPWFETTALIKKCIEEDKFIVMKKILLLSYAELKKVASNDTDSLGRAVKADLTMISSTFGWTTEEYLKTKWTEFIVSSIFHLNCSWILLLDLSPSSTYLESNDTKTRRMGKCNRIFQNLIHQINCHIPKK